MASADKNITLTHPFVKLTVGGKEITATMADCTVATSRAVPSGYAELTIPNKDGLLNGSIKKDDGITIEWGYLDPPQGLPASASIFTGTVADVNEAASIRVIARDLLAAANKTTIAKEFRHETPAAIVTALCGVAGLEPGAMPPLPKMPRIALHGHNLSRAIAEIESAARRNGQPLGGYAHFLSRDGKLQWGDAGTATNPAPSTPVTITGGMIQSARLPQAGGSGRLRTIALPWLAHSMKINVREPEILKVDAEYYITGITYRQRGSALWMEMSIDG